MNKDKDQSEEKPEEEAGDNKSSFAVKKEPFKISFSLVCMVEFFWIA